VQPLAPERYRVQFTAGAAFCDKLERLKELMRSSLPDGDLAAILEVAVTEKLERLEAKRFGSTRRPARSANARPATYVSHSRYIPAAVRRAVRNRDGNQCQFLGITGQRCSARRYLQFHHLDPWGCGGATSVENIVLMCRAHNALQAERDYGHRKMASYRRSARDVPEVGVPAGP
jgi:5-methylcytosine-specific restriction endonuclease McrA